MKYRAEQLTGILENGNTLSAFDYELYNKVIDHFEVTPDARLKVIFLAGIMVTV